MVELENITFGTEYFQDEVRDGFYVPEMMKRFWAAQLVVLSEIAKICKRHNIKWYADMGTLIGAIRHKGYIPWDDDLDISMLRDDWEAFFEYARKELPEGYLVLTVQDHEEYDLALGRITNGNAINCSKDHMKTFFGCPYTVGVDVFAMDKLYPEKEKEDDRKRRGKAIAEASSLLRTRGVNDPKVRKLLAEIERDNHITLHRRGNLTRELILLFDRIIKECRDENAKEVASMYVWIVGDWANVPIEIYLECMEAPFENTYLSIPTRYDQLLRIYYGDYLTVKRGGAGHDYPCFAGQIELLRNKLGHNPYRYTFDKQYFSIDRKKPRYRDGLMNPIKVLKRIHSQIESDFRDSDIGGGIELLQNCQDIAVSLGTLIEKRYGEGTEAVKNLETYCEEVYQASVNIPKSVSTILDKRIDIVRDEIEKLLSVRKRILFLPCRAKWWETMRPLYDIALKSENADVKVIPIPYYDCDYMGNIGECHDESNDFPRDDHFTNFDEYNLINDRPDVIVIQVPYDGASCSITVPEKLYSGELLGYADELVYIPCFDVLDPVDENDPVIATLKILVEQPAVFNADKIILKSDVLKAVYVAILTGLTGEGTKDYWQQKICLLQDYNF